MKTSSRRVFSAEPVKTASAEIDIANCRTDTSGEYGSPRDANNGKGRPQVKPR